MGVAARHHETDEHMNPDELFRAITTIIYDICGTKGSFRKEPLSEEEWADLEERVKCLFAMNRAKLFGGKNGNARRKAERSTAASSTTSTPDADSIS